MFHRRRPYETRSMESHKHQHNGRARQSRSDMARYDVDPSQDPDYYNQDEYNYDDFRGNTNSRRQVHVPHDYERDDDGYDGYRGNDIYSQRSANTNVRPGVLRRTQSRRQSFSNSVRNLSRRCGSFNLDLTEKGQAVMWGIATWLLWCFALLVLIPPSDANAIKFFTISWWWFYAINIVTLLLNLIDKINSRNNPYCFIFPELIFHLLSFLGGIPASIFFVCVLGHKAGNNSYLCSLTIVSKVHVICVITWLAYNNYLTIPDWF